jgi:uncharacterized protein (DUF58 family)
MSTSTSLRPTVFGIACAVLVVAALVVRPSVADPSVTGIVWSGLAAAILIGAVWPWCAVRLVGVRVRSAPTDLVVGELGTVELELTGRHSGLIIGCTGSRAVVVDVVSPGEVVVPITIGRRGVFGQLQVDIASDAPFGMVVARAVRVVDLPRPLLVGPAPATATAQPGELAEHRDDAVAGPPSASGDAVRSVRPYVVGDPAHLVHWPTSARTGDLVVREMEPPTRPALAIVADLGAAEGTVPDELVEAVARHVGALARDALDAGARVTLCSCEATGPVSAEVVDGLAVQRRLALATPGPVPAAPKGWPVAHVDGAAVAAVAAPGVAVPGTGASAGAGTAGGSTR